MDSIKTAKTNRDPVKEHPFMQAEEISLNTFLEAVAMSIKNFVLNVNICNIYIPPNKTIEIQELENLQQQIPKLRIILGDFNCHNVIWGCDRTNTRGRLLEEFLNRSDLVLMNTGEKTRFNSYSGKDSGIDLTLCDPTIAPLISWNIPL